MEKELLQRVITQALESDGEKSSNDNQSNNESEEEEFDGVEGVFNKNSSYFDIFDNLLRKYLCDMNQKDEEENE